MTITTNADVVGEKLNESFRALAKLTGFSERDVGRNEVGVILKMCAGKVKVANPAKIERGVRSHVGIKMGIGKAGGDNPYSLTVNNGGRGGQQGEVWFRTRKGKFQQAGRIQAAGAFIPAWIHWRNEDWQKINAGGTEYAARLRTRRTRAQNNAGLSRQAFLQMAKDLGIDLAAVKGGGNLSSGGIAKAESALASGYRNGIGTEVYEQGKRYMATLIDQLPYLFKTKPSHESVIQQVVTGRAKYFEKNMELGVFDSIQNTSRAYPWLRAEGLALAT